MIMTKGDKLTVWITDEVTGRANLTEEPQTSDDYVEYTGTPLELLDRVCSLYMQGKRGSSWSLDAAAELETFLVVAGHLDNERFTIELSSEERAMFDDADEWWRPDDEVELVCSGPHVTLVLTRRNGPWELPEGWNSTSWDREYPDGTRVIDWDVWIDVGELPKAIRMRLWSEGVVGRQA